MAIWRIMGPGWNQDCELRVFPAALEQGDIADPRVQLDLDVHLIVPGKGNDIAIQIYGIAAAHI
jgi:hypothetical protein